MKAPLPMIDIQHGEFIIKLKEFSQHKEWFATIRNGQNKTVASNWLPTQSQAEYWARNFINGLG